MLVTLIFTTILSYILIRFIISHASSLGLLDIPNERSHHYDIIPRGGGIGFIVAIVVGLMLADIQMFMHYWYVYVALGLVFSIGVFDDIYKVTVRAKILVISLAVILLWANGMSIDNLGEWFGLRLDLWWFSLPFSIVVLTGFTNALNLLDGLDSLAGAISMVILSVFAYIGSIHDDTLMVMLSCFSMVSLLGFLLLNKNPAKIFMGDSGSLSLGFLISILAVMSVEYMHPVVILYLAAVPILDTLVVMIRRIRMGRSPFSPDKTHIHHVLVKFIGNKNEVGNIINGTKRTVLFLTLLQVLFSSIGLILAEYIAKYGGVTPFFGLVGFGIIFVLIYIIFTNMQKRTI